MRYLKISAAALAALVLVGLTAVIIQDRWNQPSAPAPATLIAQAGRYHARIQRDHFGVPHISGPTDPDVAFGLGFAHSEDDFATIQDAALISRGQLASVEGAQAAVYLSGGRRMLSEGEVEVALARKDAELGRKDAELGRRDAEIERLRRLLEGHL